MPGEISNFYVTLGLKTQEFVKGIEQAKKEAQGFGSEIQRIRTPSSLQNLSSSVDRLKGRFSELKNAIAGVSTQLALIGGAIVGGLGVAITKSAEAADKIDDLSKATGVSAREISRLGYVAEQNGASISSMATGIRRLYTSMVQAEQGMKNAQDVFARLGVEVKDANGNFKTASEILPEIAEAFRRIESPAEKSYLAVELFGRSGQELIPVLDLGRSGMQKLAEEADRLGITLDNVKARQMGDFNDALLALRRSFESLIKDAIYPLILELRPMVDSLSSVISSFRGWVQEHQALTRELLKLVGGGGLLLALVGAITKLAPLVKSLSSAWNAFGVAIGLTSAQFGALAAGVYGAIALIQGFSAILSASKKRVEENRKALEQWKSQVDAMGVDDLREAFENVSLQLETMETLAQAFTDRLNQGLTMSGEKQGILDRLFNISDRRLKNQIAGYNQEIELYKELLGYIKERMEAEEEASRPAQVGAQLQSITEWIDLMTDYEKISTEQRRDLLKVLLNDEKLTAEQRAQVEKSLQQANLEIYRNASQERKMAENEMAQVREQMKQKELRAIKDRENAYRDYARNIINLANQLRSQHGLTLEVPKAGDFKAAMEIINRVILEQQKVADQAGKAIYTSLVEAQKRAAADRLISETQFNAHYISLQKSLLAQLEAIAQERQAIEERYRKGLESNRESMIRTLDQFYDFRKLVKMSDKDLEKLTQSLIKVGERGKSLKFQAEETPEESEAKRSYYAVKELKGVLEERGNIQEEYAKQMEEINKREQTILDEHNKKMEELRKNLQTNVAEIQETMQAFASEYQKALADIGQKHTETMDNLMAKLDDAAKTFLVATTNMTNAAMVMGESFKPPDLTGWDSFKNALAGMNLNIDITPLKELQGTIQTLTPAEGFKVNISIPDIDMRMKALQELKSAIDAIPSEKTITINVVQKTSGGKVTSNSSFDLKKAFEEADRKGELVGGD